MGLLVSWFFGRREVRGESERRRGWGWRSFAPLGALTLWGVADAPRAEGLDMATLGVMLEEEIVRVEAVMGRQVLETPTLRAATFEEFVSTSMVAKRLRDPRLAADPKAFTAAERALREEHANTIAVYTNYDGAITLLTDRLSETVKELGDTSAIAALRCVMDHEVAHAVQDQWVNDNFDGTLSAEDYKLGVEGQATWVEAQLCEDLDARERLLNGKSVQGAGSRTLEAYSLGWWLMEGLASRWGVEATWAALDHPPSRDATRALQRANAAPEPPSFKSHLRVIDKVRPAQIGTWETRSVERITDMVLWEAMRGPDVETPRGENARVTVSLFNTIGTLGSPIGRIGVTTLGWYHVYDEAQAARWLDRRCAALQGELEGIESIGSMTPLSGLPIDAQAKLGPAASFDLVALAPEASARCGVAGTLTGVNYVELWVLQDNTLRLLAQTYSGAEIEEPLTISRAYRGYARHAPGAKVPEEVTNEALEAGLSALVPTREGAAASPAWTRHLTRAYHDLYSARWSPCVSSAQQLLRSIPEAQREYGVWPAYYCGVMSGDDELYAVSIETIGEEEDLSDLAGGIDLFLRERGEVERAEQFMSRHCVEVGDEDPRCGM